MSPLNKDSFGIAIVGYGGMGAWHTRQIANISNLSLKGIFDISAERVEIAKENGIFAYSSLEELLNDESVKIVTVAVPNDLHYEICIKALNAGKNVVCEKPVCLSSEQFSSIIETAKMNGVVFSVHQNRRWDHDYLIAKKLVAEETMGKVFNIESRVHGSRGIPGDWRNKKIHGGGMIYDWGVHLFDQILQIAGERKLLSVYSQLFYITNEECDDGFKVLLEFEDELKCHIEVGTSNFISLPRWYINGKNGSAEIEDWDLSGKIVMVSDWEKRDAVPVVTAAGLTKTMAPRTDETIKSYDLPEVEGSIDEFYENIVSAIEGTEEQIVKNCEVMRVLKLIKLIFESAEKNEVVKNINLE